MDNAIVWHLASISQPRIARRVQAQQVESDYVGRAAARVASRVTKFVAYFGAQQLRAGINMHRKKHSRGSSSKNCKQTVGRAKTKPKTVTKIQTHAKTRMRHDRAAQRVREGETLVAFHYSFLLLGLFSGILHFKCVVYTVCEN